MARQLSGKKSGRLGFCGTAILAALSLTSIAQAQDFFGLFGGFGYRPRQPMTQPMTPFGYRPQPPMTPQPYGGEGQMGGPEGEVLVRPRPGYAYSGGSQAYCVRTCDGRHFPISSSGNQSKAASCSNLCPTAETRVVYGSSIDDAVTEGGKPYSELPNAYRYRDELVKGCTCNGKDPTGLASIRIEDDPTLRKGDIVASGDGLMVAGRGADRRGAALNLSPAPQSIRSHYRRVPVVAAQ
jgi:hypothetical protein